MRSQRPCTFCKVLELAEARLAPASTLSGYLRISSFASDGKLAPTVKANSSAQLVSGELIQNLGGSAPDQVLLDSQDQQFFWSYCFDGLCRKKSAGHLPEEAS
jgi:hypothetical protein